MLNYNPSTEVNMPRDCKLPEIWHRIKITPIHILLPGFDKYSCSGIVLQIRMETRGIATGISRSSTPSKKQFRFKVGVVGDHIQIPDLGSSLEIPCGALAHTTELAVSSPSKAPFIRPDVVVRSRLIEIQPHQEFQRTVTLKAQHDMAGLEKDKPENVQVLVHNPQTERWERIRTGRGHHGNRAADRNSEFPVHRGKWALIRDNSYEVMMSSCCTLCAVEYGVVLQAVLYGSLNQGRLELRLYLIHGVRDRMEVGTSLL